MLRIHRKDEPNSFFMTSPHSIRKDTSPGTNKNHSNHWNWFHTLSEQKPSVKPESRRTIDPIGFPISCRMAGSASLLTVDDAIAVSVC